MTNFRLNKPYSPSWNGVKPYPDPDPTKPLPPRNVFVTHPYIHGILDIRWDNPLDIDENTKWNIYGVNIYRSIDSEGGPFQKINEKPIEILYFRDRTTHALIPDEDVTQQLDKGTNPKKEWLFTTTFKPIIKQESQNILADNYADIVVKIDNGDGNALITPAYKVNGRTGEIFLIKNPTFNPKTKRYEPPRLPIADNSKVYCSYWCNVNFVRQDLYPRYFYKLTTVALNNEGNTLETNLNDVKAVNVYEIEKPHYIWKSIIVKNRYLLEQFGERGKLFIRKEVGERCINYSDTHGQAHNFCKICYGTGIVGGYYGPFDVLIAPPEAEKTIELTDIGLRLSYTFESWTGPSPLVRTRDFVVRQNGERFVISRTTPQGAKGAVFQQHFNLTYRDSKDIIYYVPIHGGEYSVPVSDDTRHVNSPITDASPQIPAYKSERAETDKGRSINYENVVW